MQMDIFLLTTPNNCPAEQKWDLRWRDIMVGGCEQNDN